jgi:hypothetical protein
LKSSINHQAWNLSRATKHWNHPLATKHWNLPLTTKHGTFQGPPNIGTIHWPPNIVTFHRSLNWVFPSPLSFSFSLKGKFGSFGTFFFGHNFQFESWENLFLQLFLGGEND